MQWSNPNRLQTKLSLGSAVTIFLLVIGCTAFAGKRIYVDTDATGVNNGSSWSNAYTFLQDALADANSTEKPVEIRVAQGIYTPDKGGGNTPGDREATFQLINSVTIKGGYAGVGEPDPNARDISKFETILSGDLDGNDVDVNNPCDLATEPTSCENSYHVVWSSNCDETAVLDGFTITRGNANGSYPHERGGGMYNDEGGQPTIIHCNFTRNSAGSGGGMFNGWDSSLKVIGCSFVKNSAVSIEWDAGGGGMYNSYANQTVVNCTFTSNSAIAKGGGIYNRTDSSPKVTDCVLMGNTAAAGGGMYTQHGSPIVTKCDFVGNSALSAAWDAGGGGMLNDYMSAPTITACNFIANSAVGDGGGIHNYLARSPIVRDCNFTENFTGQHGVCSTFRGGGISNSRSSPIVTNCTFIRNSAKGSCAGGGGMAHYYSNGTVTGCNFTGNLSGYQGGGMHNSHSSPSVTNCIFSGNLAEAEDSFAYGGGMYNGFDSNSIVTNCTFSENLVKGYIVVGRALCNYKSSPMLTNCILWGKNATPEPEIYGIATVSYSDIKGGWPGEGNIDADPLFVDPGYWDPNGTPQDANDDFWVNGDYHLLGDSPCIDAGDHNGNYDGQTDMYGDPRVMCRVDMGADEADCFPKDFSTYSDWAAMGKPDCWCYCWPYQCDGDVDGADSHLSSSYRIDAGDLQLIVDNWKKKIDDPTLNPCADIDHKAEGLENYRVFMNDLAVLLVNWMKAVAQLPGDCPRLE